MKKLLLALMVSGLFASCIKKKETTSTEAENAAQDLSDVKKDVKELQETPKDTVTTDLKEDVKKEDGLEGSKNQY